MILKPLSLDNMETIRIWRNDCRETLRTPYMLTREMQEDYYRKVICDRNSTTRYWGLWRHGYDWPTVNPNILQEDTRFVGYGGIEHIEWENSRGEISLLIGSSYREKGYGAKAVQSILNEAFNHLGLHRVYGECYYSTTAVRFWQKMVKKYKAFWHPLPDTKYYQGEYWGSYYFVFKKEIFDETTN